MDFLSLAKTRCSVRAYQPRPVEEEKLRTVLEAGRIAPSACNLQPWVFIVVRDLEAKARLAEAYPREWMAKAPVVLVLCADHSQSWKRSDGKDHGDVDIAIAADHMTLAAADQGLGTCWICAFDANKCRKALHIPEYIEPVVLLPLGYPEKVSDPDRHLERRKKLEDIVHWDGFEV